MKLFLTSHGLSNRTLVREFYDLIGKTPKNTSIVFIPTAMNIIEGHKDWFINELNMIYNTKPKFLDIVDISALPTNVIFNRFLKADVLFFSGGHSVHLLHWLYKTNLFYKMKDLLKTRVYAGISASSIITTPSLLLSNPKKRDNYKKQFGINYDNKTLHLVDFYLRPHFNNPYFPHASAKFLQVQANQLKLDIYAIDDSSAIVVNGDEMRVVSEGNWKIFQPQTKIK